jgi:phenylpropionate dioxygenase-like ring-hydroxylating dioxygenase large terminal subunit
MRSAMTSAPAIALPKVSWSFPTEAYLSEQYAREEKNKLWTKVWQIACRVEELPKVGDYVTYDILDESIIVVRTAPEKISAYYNVCQHRGRRLVEGHGQTRQFRCPFHGWTWNLEGKNVFILDPDDWRCATEQRLRLKDLKVDTWGGWVWINMDPHCGPLNEYLEPAVSMLGAFEFDKMRYRWRQWLNFRLQLESRHRGLRRELPRGRYAPTTEEVREHQLVVQS